MENHSKRASIISIYTHIYIYVYVDHVQFTDVTIWIIKTLSHTYTQTHTYSQYTLEIVCCMMLLSGNITYIYLFIYDIELVWWEVALVASSEFLY